MSFQFIFTGSSISNLLSAIQSFPIPLIKNVNSGTSVNNNLNAPTVPSTTQRTASKCSEVSAIWAPCMCSLEMCIGWYPCGLKYCKGKQDTAAVNAVNGSSNSYRCGIKTCRKCYHFNYYVRQKQQCLWDE